MFAQISCPFSRCSFYILGLPKMSNPLPPSTFWCDKYPTAKLNEAEFKQGWLKSDERNDRCPLRASPKPENLEYSPSTKQPRDPNIDATPSHTYLFGASLGITCPHETPLNHLHVSKCTTRTVMSKSDLHVSLPLKPRSSTRTNMLALQRSGTYLWGLTYQYFGASFNPPSRRAHLTTKVRIHTVNMLI